MTHRGEEHSSKAVGSAPTSVPAAALSPDPTPWDNGAPALAASLWPAIYQCASPAERTRLLQAAQAGGLLYAERLPLASAVDQGRQPLQALLDGNVDQLPPIPRAEQELQIIDQELDVEQRAAVAGILATPDVFLLQGHAGTGQNRVLVEVLRQVVAGGKRVLLVAASPAAIDRVLLALQRCEKLHALRCLAADGDEAKLPPPLRDCTLQAQRRVLEQESLPCARRARDEAARASQAIERDLQGMDSLRRLASTWQETSTRRSQLRAEKERAHELVHEDANRPVTPSAGDGALPRLLERERQRFAARIGELQQALHAAETDLRARQQARAQKFDQVHQQQLVVEIKQGRRYWKWTWWRSLFQGRAAERLAEFQTLAAEADAGFQAGQKAVQELQAQHEQEVKRHAVAVEHILANELAGRLAELDAKLLVVDQELQALREAWHAAAASVHVLAIPNHPETAAELETSRQSLDQAVGEARARLERQSQWLAALEAVVPSLARHLLVYANVVAGTPDDLAHLGVNSTSVAPPAFDWLVVVGAEDLTREQLLRWTRHTSRWLLCGQPAVAFGKPIDSAWDRLGRTLRGMPPRWPHHWVEDRNNLVCRRVRLSDSERSLLETERLVDQPDVELRIFSRPTSRPVLAEIAFPRDRFSILAAKTYVYQQLGELTLQADPHAGRWSVRGDQVCFELRDGEPGKETVLTLEPGIREILRAPAATESNGQVLRACDSLRLEFDRGAGWDRSQAERWLRDRAGLVNLERTHELQRIWQARPEIVQFWNKVLLTDLTSTGRASGEAVRFLNVTPAGVRRGPGRNVRGRHHDASDTHLGLEIDLAEPRQRQRLPFDVQTHLPARGLVNFAEAEKIVAEIMQLLPPSNGQADLPKTLAILAWHAPQAALLQALWTKAKHLNFETVPVVSLADACPLMADCVLISLTGCLGHGGAGGADHAAGWQHALMAARRQLILVGDLPALQRYAQETTGGEDRSWERALVARLLRHVEPAEGVARAARVRQGVPA